MSLVKVNVENLKSKIEPIYNTPTTYETNVPKRLDNLEWSRWHLKISILLSSCWALAALETSVLTPLLVFLKEDFKLGVLQSSFITSSWIAGGFIGAIFFGWIGDRYGRRLTFLVAILCSSIATGIAAVSPHFNMFLFFHAMTAYPFYY
jgi:MFS family permease